MSTLYACAKCTVKLPIEKLSKKELLCKKCKPSSAPNSSHKKYSSLKCHYCRTEYPPEENTSKESICKRCVQNQKTYGKPKACSLCHLNAAFTHEKCARCVSSLKKFGEPQVCDQCKVKCAFNRSEESKVKVNGKTLCYCCTMTYKKLLAKTLKRKSLKNSIDTPTKNDSQDDTPVGSADSGAESPPPVMNNINDVKMPSFEKSLSSDPDWMKTAIQNSEGKETYKEHKEKREKERMKKEIDAIKEEHEKLFESSENSKADDSLSEMRSNDEDGSASKKLRLDNGSSYLTKSSSSSNIFDLAHTDNNIIAQSALKEEVELLKKQVSKAQNDLIVKEAKMTELKATHYESDRLLRNRLFELDKKFSSSVEDLKGRNLNLLKQNQDLTNQLQAKKKSRPLTKALDKIL